MEHKFKLTCTVLDFSEDKHATENSAEPRKLKQIKVAVVVAENDN